MAAFRVFSRNLPYLRQQFSALLGNTSPSVKFICGVVIIGYILSFSDDVVNTLSITPGNLLPPSLQLWSTLTFWFLEIHLWEVIIDIVTVGLCGKLIEPLWGQIEMIRFFVVVNIGVALLTTFLYLTAYAITERTSYLFFSHVHGLAGYLAGVCVAVKQIMPDHLIVKTPLGKLTNRSLPMLLLFLAILLWAVGALPFSYPCMWASGTLVSWIYLRFWQQHSSGTRGDMADNFSFDKQIALKALSERLSKTSEQTRQKNLSTKVNMENVRKMQSSQVIPQFTDASPSQPISPPEATLVDLDEPAPPTSKQS